MTSVVTREVTEVEGPVKAVEFYFCCNGKTHAKVNEAGMLQLIKDMNANGVEVADAINAIFVMQRFIEIEAPRSFYGDETVKGMTDGMVGIRVSSSNIDAVAYDAANQRLYVFYKDGDWYRYVRVPAEVYTQVITAESIGRAVNELVKRPEYDFKKMNS